MADTHRQAGGHANLFAHDIDTGDGLRYGMLDLQAGVHFDEKKLAVLIEKLDGAGAAIGHFAHRLDHAVAYFRACLGVEGRRGRLFQQLLVAALQRTVAFAEVDRFAPAVRHQLDLDVARSAQVLLNIDLIVAEGGLGLAAGQAEGTVDFFRALGNLHAASAATGRRLDEDGIADLTRGLAGFFHAFHRALGARHGRQAELDGGLLGGHLVAHEGNMFRGRPDKGEAVLLHHGGKLSILG